MIALITDFGTEDFYTGVVKGVIKKTPALKRVWTSFLSWLNSFLRSAIEVRGRSKRAIGEIIAKEILKIGKAIL